MADTNDFDWHQLLEPASPQPTDELAELLGEIARADLPPTTLLASAEPLPDEDVVSAAVASQSSGPAWNKAVHLLPPWAMPLISRYPSIGVGQSTLHGRVLWAVYLEDTQLRLRRNLQIGNDVFFHAEELEKIEPNTKELGCRVVLKAFSYRVGLRVRYWENTPTGDVPGKTGAFILTEQGLRQVGAKPAR